MITRPTVFVLGAGASSCYDFPLGQKLCELLISEVRPGHQTRDVLLANGFGSEFLGKFRDELLYSGQNSIDAFLENREEFLEVGKAGMAVILVRCEQPGRLWQFLDNNWMRYLLGRMRTPFDKFSENKVSFVTFNFDRSLEHFLFTSLKSGFGRSDAECANAIEQIPIIHLHGRLGYLPWQTENGRPYENHIEPSVVTMCVRNIKVVHEELNDGRDKDFTNAKQVMEEAERIYFLGFGFGQTNIERLALTDLAVGKAEATAYGLTAPEAAEVYRRCAGKIQVRAGVDIDNLFRNMVQWD